MIQSLLTQEEYDTLSKIYKTYNVTKRKSAKPIRIVSIDGKEFECGPPPNYIMGNSLTQKEIKTINKNIDMLIETKVLLLSDQENKKNYPTKVYDIYYDIDDGCPDEYP
jgi:hypothetical protein